MTPNKQTIKKIEAFFIPLFCGINIRVDNRIGRNRLHPDKKHKGFLLCNQETYDRIKNHPELKDYNFL